MLVFLASTIFASHSGRLDIVREVTEDDQTDNFANLLDAVEAIPGKGLVDSVEGKHQRADNRYVSLDDIVGGVKRDDLIMPCVRIILLIAIFCW